MKNKIYNLRIICPEFLEKAAETIIKSKIENFYLLFYKFPSWGKEEQEKTEKFKINGLKGFKARYFDKIMDTLNNFHNKIKEGMKQRNYFVKEFTFKPDWRLIIGLGDDSVYEVAITLHYIYGIPYIPATAIKGVTRNWIIISKFDRNEKNALKDKDFYSIFGAPEESETKQLKGKVIFFDAYPVESPQFEFDIMTPHYQEYYMEGKQPGDYYEPVPIQFLTVANTKFKFLIASKDKNLLETTENWIRQAFEENGIGAKTSLGYGMGKIIST